MNRIYSETNVEIAIPVQVLSKLVEFQAEVDDLLETAALTAPTAASFCLQDAKRITRQMVNFFNQQQDQGSIPSHVSLSELNLRLIPALAS